MSKHDIELMQHVDGELDDKEIRALVDKDEDARTKLAAVTQLGELVKGHLELSADAIPDRRFDAMWRQIDKAIEIERPIGMWSRVKSWFENHRGHVITGMVSAGAVAALALVLRGNAADDVPLSQGAIDVQPAALRAPPVIEDLETPGGNSTVLNVEDEDGHMTVIVVTPEDTVEGI
jgi:hypothetical protein